MTDPGGDRSSIDELLDSAVRAINCGDRATAEALAGRVLAVDETNIDAEELLAAPAGHGELRRLTIMFADLVDSTELSTRIEPETYRTVVGRYRDEVIRIVNSYDGHIGNTKGDGLLAVFGHPHAHENDVWRAVQAGVEITRGVAKLSERVRRRFGFDISVRVGVHRGLVYLDTAQDDVYGFAANLAARMCSIAEPGTVAVSEAVERLVRDKFDLEARPPQQVKGVKTPVVSYRPTAERDQTLVSPGPLIGRQVQRAYLAARLQETEAGSLTETAVALCGEPGIGKSRLAREAADVATDSGGVVIELFGSPFHTDVGLHPVRRLLERRCGIKRSFDGHQRLRLLDSELRARSLDSDTLIPLLGPVLGVQSSAGYVPAAAEGLKLQQMITAALQEYLLACVGSNHAVAIIEDMHWFDPSTTEVVSSLIGAAMPRLLLVMTSRNLASLPDMSKVKVFELSPLTMSESNELISALHPEMSASDRGTVGNRCGGVPLYIEEVVAKLKARQDDSAEATKVPDSLYEALFARLRSSEKAVRVVEAAATIGTVFDRSILGHVQEMTDETLDEVLEELRRATVFVPVGDGLWRWRHELLREVAAELPPPSAQRSLHGRVADALESASPQGNPDWPLIAAHYVQAQRFDDAVLAYREASTIARHRGALSEALTYLSRAMTQLEKLPEGPERDRREMHVRLRRGFLWSALEGPGSAHTAEDFERCLQLGGADPFTDELFWTLQALFTYYVSRADIRRAQQIDETLALGLGNGREKWRTEVVGGAGTLSFLRGEFTDAARLLSEAHAHMAARRDHDFDAEWFMPYDAVVLHYTSLAHTRWVLGDLEGADAAFVRSDDRGKDLGFPQGPYSMCYARWVQAWAYLEAGLYARAAEVAADMVQQSQPYGFDHWTGLGYTLIATASAAAALAAGNLDAPEIADSISGLVGWTSASRFMGVAGWVTWFDGQAARLLIAADRLTEARQQVDLGLRLGQESGMSFYDAELTRLRAATHDDPADQHADLLAAFELAVTQGTPVFALRAALDDFRLRGEAARPLVDQAVAMFPAGSTWPELANVPSMAVTDALS